MTLRPFNSHHHAATLCHFVFMPHIDLHLSDHISTYIIQAYANSKGIKVIGDMPIYVGGHSADVWSNQKLFELGPTGAPANVSGVPPDAFSKTGQLWPPRYQ